MSATLWRCISATAHGAIVMCVGQEMMMVNSAVLMRQVGNGGGGRGQTPGQARGRSRSRSSSGMIGSLMCREPNARCADTTRDSSCTPVTALKQYGLVPTGPCVNTREIPMKNSPSASCNGSLISASSRALNLYSMHDSRGATINFG